MNIGSISSVSNTDLFKILSGCNTKIIDKPDALDSENSVSTSSESEQNNYDTVKFSNESYERFFNSESQSISTFMEFGRNYDKPLSEQFSVIGKRIDSAHENGQLSEKDYNSLNSELINYAKSVYEGLQVGLETQKSRDAFYKMLHKGLFDGMNEDDVTSVFQDMKESAKEKVTTSDEYKTGLSAFLNMIEKMRSEPNENNTKVAETNYQELSDTISDMQEKTLAKINNALNDDTHNVKLSLDLTGTKLDVQA